LSGVLLGGRAMAAAAASCKRKNESGTCCMKYVRYKKYTGQEADDVDLQELMNRLSNFLLQSGFESQYYGFQEMDPERSMEKLRQAILRALEEGELLPSE